MDKFDTLLNRFGLAFASAADEESFTDAHVRNSTRINQIFLAIGAFAYASYYVWDGIIDPENQHLAIMIRIFFVGPTLLACAASLFFGPFMRRVEAVVVSAGIALFVAQSWIYIILDNGFNYAAMGFVLTFLAMATAFVIRVRYLLILSPVALLTAVLGHIYANNAQPGWLIVNILGISAAVMIGMVSATIRERAARTQFMSERALAQSTARADELLHSILPGDIVERIQNGETDISDMLGEVSIVFADLAGFTSLSRRLSPPDLIRLLDEIFSRFDRAAQRYAMNKIYTIGDAYMAVGGMSRSDDASDHAENAANFALAIQAEIQKMIAETGYPIALRVGLHIGAVITGVVGVRRPSFDCWGESVDLASGLEGRAPPGGILISESAYDRLRSKFATSPVRLIELKGVNGRSRVRLLLGPVANDRDANQVKPVAGATV
ncbi:MAG: adenylate/guanylate cyclase domain-containing protein [Pseudomonadota bacterium]